MVHEGKASNFISQSMPHLDANKLTETREKSGKKQDTMFLVRCLDCRQTPNTKEASMCQTSIIFELCLEPHTKKKLAWKKSLRGVTRRSTPFPGLVKLAVSYPSNFSQHPFAIFERRYSPTQESSRSCLRFICVLHFLKDKTSSEIILWILHTLLAFAPTQKRIPDFHLEWAI